MSPRILVALLLTIVAGKLWALPLHIDGHQDVVALGPYTRYFVDEQRTLTIDSVQTATFTPASTPALNFGFTQARVWLRFQLNNTLDTEVERVLDIRHFLLDVATLYSPEPDGHYAKQENGRLHPYPGQHELSRFFTFSLRLAPHSQNVFYLAIESGDSIGLPIFLSTPKQQHRYQIRDTLLLTLYSGLMLSTLLFAIFMMVSLRERELFYYVGFLLAHHLFALMAIEGVPSSLLGATSVFIVRDSIPFSISVAILLSILFMRNFLHFKTVNPALHRFTNWMVAVMCVTVVLSLALDYFYAILTTTVLCMNIGAGILACCFIQAPRQREARYFLAAWSAGILGATFYGLKAFNLLPVNDFTIHSWHAGAMIEAILFTYTIAQRVNFERKQRLDTQTALADRERTLRLTQEQLLQAEIMAKEELETRVRERTRDISRILAELEHENKNLVELSINDGLTRVRNRRFFNDIYPQLWQEAMERNTWLSLLMVDIDHFKTVNDRYGHLMGDRCLSLVASVLKHTASRPGDVVCRYGGEEFVILLPETDAEAALRVAERIRIRISEANCDLGEQSITVTASLGVASAIPDPATEPTQLLGQCDAALYQSKQTGRNRTTLAPQPAIAPDRRRQHN